jgi:L-amino acid N-acyltransferase YncA
MKIKIRLAEDTDFEEIYTIWLEGIHNSFDYTTADMEKVREKFASNFFSRNGIFNFWLAVDENERILGWQSLIPASNHPFRVRTLAESSTYISKLNRFKGVGKCLLEHVMAEAEKSELEYVVGFVALTNEAAQRVTTGTGWHVVGSIPDSKKKKDTIKKLYLIRPV